MRTTSERLETRRLLDFIKGAAARSYLHVLPLCSLDIGFDDYRMNLAWSMVVEPNLDSPSVANSIFSEWSILRHFCFCESFPLQKEVRMRDAA